MSPIESKPQIIIEPIPTKEKKFKKIEVSYHDKIKSIFLCCITFGFWLVRTEYAFLEALKRKDWKVVEREYKNGIFLENFHDGSLFNEKALDFISNGDNEAAAFILSQEGEELRWNFINENQVPLREQNLYHTALSILLETFDQKHQFNPKLFQKLMEQKDYGNAKLLMKSIPIQDLKLRDGNHPIFRYHDLKDLKFWANNGLDFNLVDSDNITTLLRVCVNEGKTDIIEFLLEHGATVTFDREKNKTANSLLFTAISKSTNYCIKLLLSHGADPRDEIDSKLGLTALNKAIDLENIEVVELLLKNLNQRKDQEYINAALKHALHNFNTAFQRALGKGEGHPNIRLLEQFLNYVNQENRKLINGAITDENNRSWIKQHWQHL